MVRTSTENRLGAKRVEGLFHGDDFGRVYVKDVASCQELLHSDPDGRPKRNEPGVEKIIWEHGRRNFALRADGVLPIVCPVNDGSNVKGVGIFNASVEQVKKIMDEDPGVKAGVFVYGIHVCRGFPRDCLPE